MRVREDASDDKKAALMEVAYRDALINHTEPLMAQWAETMGVQPGALKTQRMTSRWGSCHISKGVIKLNSELARKPKYMLEYVLVHELVHLFERGHNARFYGLMDRFLPDWKSRKAALNNS
jgi:predicted metal-dependent hydrolase